MVVNLPALLGNYDRPTNQPTNRPTDMVRSGHKEVSLPIDRFYFCPGLINQRGTDLMSRVADPGQTNQEAQGLDSYGVKKEVGYRDALVIYNNYDY